MLDQGSRFNHGARTVNPAVRHHEHIRGTSIRQHQQDVACIPPRVIEKRPKLQRHGRCTFPASNLRFHCIERFVKIGREFRCGGFSVCKRLQAGCRKEARARFDLVVPIAGKEDVRGVPCFDESEREAREGAENAKSASDSLCRCGMSGLAKTSGKTEEPFANRSKTSVFHVGSRRQGLQWRQRSSVLTRYLQNAISQYQCAASHGPWPMDRPSLRSQDGLC